MDIELQITELHGGFYPFCADYFGFKDYHSTSNFDTAIDYLKQGYFVVVSCGYGLFTTQGHYIVLVADNDGVITTYDPYLYNGKFNTASRKYANVKVSGNNVYVTEEAFKTYANAKNYWIFSNDNGEGNPNNATTQETTQETKQETSYVRYVSTSSGNLNVRNNPNGTVVGKLSKGTQVTVYEVNGNWSRIGENRWVSSSYLSSVQVSTQVASSVNNTVNTSVKYKITASSLRIRKSASTSSKQVGSYTKGTIVEVTSINGTWGKTNKGYISLKYATKVSTTTTTNTTASSSAKYYRLKVKSTLYSKSNLSGTKYTYFAGTQVKLIKKVSSKVAYVYVTKTGRYAYVNISNLNY